jgi:hypothetical protein
MSKKPTADEEKDECVTPSYPIPARELSQYSVESDPHREQDMANYVQGQASDETVQHVERIKQEVVLAGC